MSTDSPPRLGTKTTSSTWLSQEETPQVIQDFLKHYSQTHYHHLANRAKELIEQEVAKDDWKDVNINVRARGKAEKSLRDKLIMRHADNPYKEEQDIWDDIHDLAGTRIILYMPSEDQREKVKRIIQNIWGEDVQPKYHEGIDDRPKEQEREEILRVPEEIRKRKKKYRRRHLGYTAVHYRCKMKEDQQKDPDYFYKSTDRVEIQVVSALSHAWAEAGHDILYKSYAFGQPTLQEELLLDSLNGIVLSGDLLLEQFHELVMKRTYAKFRHRGDFGTFLRDLDVLQPQDDNDERQEFEMECLDVILKFLQATNRDFPMAVRNAFKNLGFPHNPDLKGYMAREIRPSFNPAKTMLTTTCLLHHLLHTKAPAQNYDPTYTPPTTLCPREQCETMLNALLLLQSLFPRPDLANSFLRSLHLDTPQLKSLDFVLSNCRRQLLLDKDSDAHSDKDADDDSDADADCDCKAGADGDGDGDAELEAWPDKASDEAGYAEYEKKIGKSLKPAWEWFTAQAGIKRSICGMVFRLAQMGATRKADWALVLGQLRIGGIISRASTGSIDGDGQEREEERNGILFGRA